MSRASVKNALRRLDELGVISVEHREATTSVFTVPLATMKGVKPVAGGAGKSLLETGGKDLTPNKELINNKSSNNTGGAPRPSDDVFHEEPKDTSAGWIDERTAHAAAEAGITAMEDEGVPLRTIVEQTAQRANQYQIVTDLSPLPRTIRSGEWTLDPEGDWRSVARTIVIGKCGPVEGRIMTMFLDGIAPLVATGEVPLHLIEEAAASGGGGLYALGAVRHVAVGLSARRMSWLWRIRAIRRGGSGGRVIDTIIPSRTSGVTTPTELSFTEIEEPTYA